MSLINAAGNNSSNYEHSCTYYWKDNHTIYRCYRKNGFPQNYASRGGKRSQSNPSRGNLGVKGNKVYTYCGFSNHIVDDCYKKHGYPLGHKLYKV